MRTLVAFAGLVLGAIAPLALVTPADAAGETCNGLPATMVGTPGSTVTGTDGPDVIVSAGAAEVLGNGGNDTICTTLTAPGPPKTSSIQVSGGPGNDFIDRRGDTDRKVQGLVTGDAGQDTILGAPGADVFETGDGEHDVVSTGDGDDLGTDGGTDGLADADTIDLGAGDDEFSAQGPYAAPLTIEGGPGTDTIDWLLPGANAYVVDALAGVFRSPAGVSTSFTGFEEYGATTSRRATWSFRGSQDGESVSGFTGQLTSAAMRGGGDRIQLVVDSKRPTAHIDGGHGRDRVELSASGSTIVVDLDRGRYRLGDAGHSRLQSFEDASVVAGDVSLRGTGGRNTLEVLTCRRGYVAAGGGADVVSLVRDAKTDCSAGPRPVVDGGTGPDVITGSRLADLLIGGPGDDTADGAGGRDTCRSVETRTSCERR